MRLFQRLTRVPDQFRGRSPFAGTLPVQRLPLIRSGLVTASNFRTPLRILDFVFNDDGDLKYLDVPGFPPFLFVRDPELIRKITVETALDGAFDRDTLPTQGIGRVVGKENLLYSQGEVWRKHKGAVVRPLGTIAVQTEEVFHDLEKTIRKAVEPQLEDLVQKVRRSPTHSQRMRLEPDIQAVMLNVLVNVLFGAAIAHEQLRTKYLPAIRNVIAYILIDTIANQLRMPVCRLPAIFWQHAQLKRDRRTFEELVDRVIRTRDDGAGFWPLLTAAGTETTIRSNVRVFLAGALEATSSYISWTLSNLARDPVAQERAYQEATSFTEITPEARERSVYLQHVLAESLRLNNALYFLPRVALRDTTVTTSHGTLTIPADTHIVLATYHANRCERHWGVEATGYPATAFAPDRWDAKNMESCGRSSKDNLHFGFGHGPRVCIGKHFSEAEAFVCMVLFLRRFRFRAVYPTTDADSGVSTRPRDGVDLELSLRY
ncbi:MAG TPA: cytochrome P450 [Gemmataceae bacterium]|nr:cytochrome P450 [Gemmataceae bacterium]